ncbi:hypothetical protein [Actinobacillus suis]|uniref:hypothetical protein n=1 Tax=Actinobacillus suis TaxID=716 RepID=UPI0004E7E030|nr:hypothetical protein [Actinobacillus suis]AIJ31179.1 hypothetical protein ASU1_04555 [Actinobacillus suis ATCC 33415]SNV30695.1 Uncharacterised protein [Actinobacillus suis]
MNRNIVKASSHKLGAETRSLLVKAEIAKQCVIPETVKLGTISATRAVIELLGKNKALELIHRHEYKDYGDLDEHDIYANELSLLVGNRIVSSYQVENEKIFIITEADRSYTTIMMANEY